MRHTWTPARRSGKCHACGATKRELRALAAAGAPAACQDVIAAGLRAARERRERREEEEEQKRAEDRASGTLYADYLLAKDAVLDGMEKGELGKIGHKSPGFMEVASRIRKLQKKLESDRDNRELHARCMEALDDLAVAIVHTS